MKRAYIVTGPESSGNRILASLLIAAGCDGGTGFDHPLMHEYPSDQDPVVMVRSYPHGNDWPDLAEMYRILRGRGYMVRVLVTVRDPFCVIESNVGSRNHPRELAWSNYQRSYRDIFAQLAEVNVWYAMVPYESLTMGGKVAAKLLDTLGLLQAKVEFRDENAKYFRSEAA